MLLLWTISRLSTYVLRFCQSLNITENSVQKKDQSHIIRISIIHVIIIHVCIHGIALLAYGWLLWPSINMMYTGILQDQHTIIFHTIWCILVMLYIVFLFALERCLLQRWSSLINFYCMYSHFLCMFIQSGLMF